MRPLFPLWVSFFGTVSLRALHHTCETFTSLFKSLHKTICSPNFFFFWVGVLCLLTALSHFARCRGSERRRDLSLFLMMRNAAGGAHLFRFPLTFSEPLSGMRFSHCRAAACLFCCTIDTTADICRTIPPVNLAGPQINYFHT